jgi:hypothetical protein
VVEPTMDILNWLRKRLEQASPDLLREMVESFAEALMSAEADALCGAGYRERSPDRVNIRNGYRERAWDTRVGTIELEIPKLRSGTYFPDWLLTRAGGPSRRWFRSSPTRTSPASRRGGLRSSLPSSASSGSRRARSPGWRRHWTSSSRTSARARSSEPRTRT